MHPRKLSTIKILQLRQDYRAGCSLHQVAVRYQVSYSTARNLVRAPDPRNPEQDPRETRQRSRPYKLTATQAAQLVAERSTGSLRSLGQKYGIDPITVWRYVKRAQAAAGTSGGGTKSGS